MTVGELVVQHEKCAQALEDLDDINLLYPEAGCGADLPGQALYEAALLRFVEAKTKMLKMMVAAGPEMVAEARRMARSMENDE